MKIKFIGNEISLKSQVKIFLVYYYSDFCNKTGEGTVNYLQLFKILLLYLILKNRIYITVSYEDFIIKENQNHHLCFMVPNTDTAIVKASQHPWFRGMQVYTLHPVRPSC